uniref:Reverse transcriptase zinc-binding domain-containing protein n=1 Tax=Ananas comosus var. bracteatus TaxID=296719 RepID=A0A6V7QEP2_ANACO|nr:unnamed protein product [Ananas comosus var. bracteatus]
MKICYISAYSFLIFDGISNGLIPFLWILKIPIRVKNFLWLTVKSKMLTASLCVLCNSDSETMEHLILDCSYSNSMWIRLLHSAPTAYHRLSNSPGGIAVRWCSSRLLLTGEFKKNFDLYVAAGCWELWKERNRRLFDNKSQRSEILARAINDTIKQWVSALGC